MAKESSTMESEMRKDYISKEDYFMGIAVLSSQRSKDPATQVGACIVNDQHRIVGIGYNGMPNRIDDEKMPWREKGDTAVDTKHMYACHAEMNAIVNKYAADIRGCSMYVNTYPCNECAKLIVQAGLSNVFHTPMPEGELDEATYTVAKAIFELADVKIRKLPIDTGQLKLRLSCINSF